MGYQSKLDSIKTTRLYSFGREKYFDFKDRNLVAVLKQNAKFQNAYPGKRCFIFGNGPSLKNVDFSLFRDEYTFTVTDFL